LLSEKVHQVHIVGCTPAAKCSIYDCLVLIWCGTCC